MLSEWEDHGSTTWRVSAAIWLPSVISTKDCNFNVSLCGTVLKVNLTCPLVSMDKLILRKFRLKNAEEAGCIRAYHSKIHGFEKCMKTFSSKRSSAVVSTGYMDLPGKVETHFEETVFFCWRNTPKKNLYVTMRCTSYEYGYNSDGMKSFFPTSRY